LYTETRKRNRYAAAADQRRRARKALAAKATSARYSLDNDAHGCADTLRVR